MAGSGKAHLRPGAHLVAEDLVVEFPVSSSAKVHAVSGVSIDVLPGEIVGLVGESGCGKSTLGRALVGLVPPTAGSVRFDGEDLAALSSEVRRRLRVKLQMIFQDPISSLNPRRTVEDIVGEGLRIWRHGSRTERAAKVEEVMEAVGLAYDPGAKRRRRQFSGGQCQRISIARALVLSPEVLICDEPVSALDLSVQAQILNLLLDMQQRYGLSLLLIAHDLAVVKHVSDRVVVMYLGKICEVAPAEALYDRPRHPYTRLLFDSVPAPVESTGSRLAQLADRAGGEIPSPISPPSGCRFRTRCPRAGDRCSVEEPTIRLVGDGHYVACHFPHDDGGTDEHGRDWATDDHAAFEPAPSPEVAV